MRRLAGPTLRFSVRVLNRSSVRLTTSLMSVFTIVLLVNGEQRIGVYASESPDLMSCHVIATVLSSTDSILSSQRSIYCLGRSSCLTMDRSSLSMERRGGHSYQQFLLNHIRSAVRYLCKSSPAAIHHVPVWKGAATSGNPCVRLAVSRRQSVQDGLFLRNARLPSPSRT